MTYKRCPHCKEKISRLKYKAQIKEYLTRYLTEYGSSNFEGERYWEDSDENSEDTDDTVLEEVIYYCPKCEEEVELEDLVKVKEEEKNEKKENIAETKEHIIIPEQKVISRSEKEKIKKVICPKCKRVNNFPQKTPLVECDFCGEIIKYTL